MIIEKNGLLGLKSDLAHLDDVSSKLGFVRWQWEYTRATYDLKLVDKTDQSEYFCESIHVQNPASSNPHMLFFT